MSKSAITSNHRLVIQRDSKAIKCFATLPGDPLAENKLLYEIEGDPLDLCISSDGSFGAALYRDRFIVFKLYNAQVVFEASRPAFDSITISPKGSYVATWEYLAKGSKKNLHVYHVPTSRLVASFCQTAKAVWHPLWTDDESTMVLVTAPNTLTIYPLDPKNFADINDPENSPEETLGVESRQLKITDGNAIEKFSIGPSNPPLIAVFSRDKTNARPAAIRMYKLDGSESLVVTKTFYNSDKVVFKWNSSGQSVLALSSTAVDKSGKSYYGNTALYMISAVPEYNANVKFDKEGGIHDFQWAPNGREFAVIYGSMPPTAVLMSAFSRQVYSFGEAARNSLLFSPNGRFLMIGGFGNMTGEMDIWDMIKYEKLATVNVPNTTYTEWTPDGAYLMTATLAPRMRVDNGWKIYHYQGVCIHKQESNGILQAFWRPQIQPRNLAGSWARRSLSPPPESRIPVSLSAKAIYRPPSARAAAAGSQGVVRPQSSIPGAVYASAQARKSARKSKKVVNIEAKS